MQPNLHRRVALSWSLGSNRNKSCSFLSQIQVAVSLKRSKLQSFRRFEKLNENAQGSGLGLSICQLIIEHIGGKIWIDSDYTGGSRFFFTHPIRQSQSTNPQKENNA